MKHVMVLFVAMVFALTLGTAGWATAPYKAPTKAPGTAFAVEGKLAQVSNGYFEIEVTKILSGQGIKVKEKLRVSENSQTAFRKAGKAVSSKMLKTGEMVRVWGQIIRSKTAPVTYRATTISIL
jgi:hypothetical protein